MHNVSCYERAINTVLGGKKFQSNLSENKFITLQLKCTNLGISLPSPFPFSCDAWWRCASAGLHSPANVLAKADSIRLCMHQTHLWPFLISSFSLGHDTSGLLTLAWNWTSVLHVEAKAPPSDQSENDMWHLQQMIPTVKWIQATKVKNKLRNSKKKFF